ncbi:MAG TPA: type II toxin-antitoxin system antitoxin SocA domain-containing protein [Cyclobacteriaceae bacterium]|nr:type II toxin-antitoxin system antitoxin SocA domain-containing protein [Cyclobacteriaceae bacterium]
MESPFTGGETKLLSEKKEFEFRREKFQVVHFFYKCVDTKEEFTTDQLDELNTNQLYNQYREKYSIPFPDEIKEIREQYEISASKMSEVLGLGANSYRQYESGEMPTVSNGRLIQAAKDPEEFKKFIDASRAVLSPKEHDKFLNRANELIEASRKNPFEKLFEEQIFVYSKPSEFTGYRSPSIEKIAHTISYFCVNVKDLWKTKLNKLLFYSDFLNYKRTGFSVSGMAYRAIQLGPVPSEYDKLYVKLIDDKKFDVDYVPFDNGYVGEGLRNRIDFNKDLFTPGELNVLNEVAKKFKSKTSTEIIELSHKEKAWLENEKKHEIISYQKYAFDLNAL